MKTVSMRTFSDRLLTWYDGHGRKDFPWQIEKTPYSIWVSEIMLQQTQVKTVIPYFKKFIVSFPTLRVLAEASLDDVLHHWSGLGYYARARNLHKTACLVNEKFSAQLPLDMDGLCLLPGIGRSTAGAILALSCNQKHPILDGNVRRVFTRHKAIKGWPGKTMVQNVLWKIAEDNTPSNRVADYTQAIMDLGAIICTRSHPRCELCPVNKDCIAHSRGQEAEFPHKNIKKTNPLKTTNMLFLRFEDRIYLERRPSSGVWGGLWSFPEISKDCSVSDWYQSRFGTYPLKISRWKTLQHKFSHFDLKIHLFKAEADIAIKNIANNDSALWYKSDSQTRIGLAAPVKKLLETQFNIQ